MQIGEKIRMLRLKRNLTQEELADRCELSKSFISQLENDYTSPSIETLEDIVTALGTTLKWFFSDDKEEKTVFNSEDFFEKRYDDSVWTWLVPNSQKNEMEPIKLELAPHAALDKDMPHEGEEFGFVMSGSVVLHIGKKEFVARKGDAFYYESNKVHYLENRTAETAVVLWVASPPTF